MHGESRPWLNAQGLVSQSSPPHYVGVALRSSTADGMSVAQPPAGNAASFRASSAPPTESESLDELRAAQQRTALLRQRHELTDMGGLLGGALRTLVAPRGPEWPHLRRRPPFAWQPSVDFAQAFRVSGDSSEVVTKVGDVEDVGWVVPVGSTLRLAKGAVYRWTLVVEQKCPRRPQLQLGLHGCGHRRPWRVLSTCRCSRARDDDPWCDRPGGDRAIEEGDFVHIEADLRGLHLPFGTMSLAVNGESPEVVFDDIPLSSALPMMPVVAMGGDGARVRLCPPG